MQPSPIADTSKPLFPSLRFCIWRSLMKSGTQEPDFLIIYCAFLLGSLRLKGGHVDRETILHIGLEQSLVRLVDFLNWDDFYVSGDVMFAAKIEHFLRFGDTANA